MSSSEHGQPHRRESGHGWLRNALALVVLGIVGAICFSLGQWQLDRAAERDTLHKAIEHGRLQTPLMLASTTPGADLLPWRAATAQGQWSPQHTVLLQNRNLEGRPGYWVATPLLLTPPAMPSSRNDAVSAGSAELAAVAGRADAGDFLGRGPAGGETAVLVLRGWLPRDMQAAGAAPAIPQETGLVEVRGELHTHVPRIFELWQWAGGEASHLPPALPQADGVVPQLQNLSLAEYAEATGLQLLPIVLAQTEASTTLAAGPQAGTAAAPELRREWPGPSLDSDQNRGYALQWFSFSGIAAIAALFVVRAMWRRRRIATRSKDVS